VARKSSDSGEDDPAVRLKQRRDQTRQACASSCNDADRKAQRPPGNNDMDIRHRKRWPNLFLVLSGRVRHPEKLFEPLTNYFFLLFLNNTPRKKAKVNLG